MATTGYGVSGSVSLLWPCSCGTRFMGVVGNHRIDADPHRRNTRQSTTMHEEVVEVEVEEYMGDA